MKFYCNIYARHETSVVKRHTTLIRIVCSQLGREQLLVRQHNTGFYKLGCISPILLTSSHTSVSSDGDRIVQTQTCQDEERVAKV